MTAPGDRGEGVGRLAASGDRAAEASPRAPTGLGPDGSASTGAEVVPVSPDMLAAWVDWDPGYEPTPPLSVRQAGFVRQAFYAGWLAAEQARPSGWQPIETALADEMAGALEALVSSEALTCGATAARARHRARDLLKRYRDSNADAPNKPLSNQGPDHA